MECLLSISISVYLYVYNNLHSQLRVVKGRLERPDELGTLISDPQLEKYRAQQRILLWYDMNEDMSSDTVRYFLIHRY